MQDATRICHRAHTKWRPREMSPTQNGSHTKWRPHKMAPTQNYAHTKLRPHKITSTQHGSHTKWRPRKMASTQNDARDTAIRLDPEICPVHPASLLTIRSAHYCRTASTRILVLTWALQWEIYGSHVCGQTMNLACPRSFIAFLHSLLLCLFHVVFCIFVLRISSNHWRCCHFEDSCVADLIRIDCLCLNSKARLCLYTAIRQSMSLLFSVGIHGKVKS